MMRFAIALTPFMEERQRVFGEGMATMYFDAYDIASGNALILSRRLRPLVDALATALGADGIAVDVYPTETREDGSQRDFAILESIELMPGRQLVYWCGDESHDNGYPRLDMSAYDL